MNTAGGILASFVGLVYKSLNKLSCFQCLSQSLHKFLQQLPPIPDEIPCCFQQVPATAPMPSDYCFRPWSAWSPSTKRLHGAPIWFPCSSRLLWWDGSEVSLSTAVGWRDQSSRFCGSCRDAWRSKSDTIQHNGKPRDPSLPFCHAQS